MFAARLHGPRDMRIEEVPLPATGEVLVRIKATGICGSDLHTYLDGRIGDTKLEAPLTLGHEFAGTVVEVGKLVTDVHLNDRVTAEGHIVCGRCHLCRTGNSHVCPNTKIIGVDLKAVRRIDHVFGAIAQLFHQGAMKLDHRRGVFTRTHNDQTTTHWSSMA